MINAGTAFRESIKSNRILETVGIYDSFSALIASRYYDGIFCSGYSFAASTYGLPDIGFITWRDIVEFSRRLRHLLPKTHIITDIDDGFGDKIVAAHAVCCLESYGISAIIMEDQKRPRKCGHIDGKKLLPIKEYLDKLKYVKENTSDKIFLIARTDEQDPDKGLHRAICYAEAGANGIMIEAIHSLDIIRKLKQSVDCTIVVNQLNGGKSPNWTMQELKDAGVSIIVYSTACLFAAQYGMENYMNCMKKERRLSKDKTVTLSHCNQVLAINSSRK